MAKTRCARKYIRKFKKGRKTKRCRRKRTKRTKSKRRRKKIKRFSMRRKRKQKGGVRTPGNWLKINEIHADDVCIFCEESLMHPKTLKQTVYMMSCCVNDAGEGLLAHTGCIKDRCESGELSCPVCGDGIWEACADMETHYDPPADILDKAPITENEGLQYYNPALPTDKPQRHMPGGSKRRKR